MLVRFGALKIAQLLNLHIDCWFEKNIYLKIYVTSRIGITHQYQAANDRYLVFIGNGNETTLHSNA